MKRPVLFLLAVLAVSSAPKLGAAAPQFTMTIDTVWAMGDTRYLMEEPGIIPTGVPRGVSSELIFPLNTLVEGMRFHYMPARPGGLRWSLEVSVHTNLIKPYGLMLDYDWWMFPGSPKVPFFYTESAAVMRWCLAGAELQFDLRSGAWGRVALAFGYRFQFINQLITGYKGWTLDDNLDGTLEPYTPEQNLNDYVLDYMIFYNTATAGLTLTLNPAPPVSVTAEAGFALPYVYDYDDHLLRHKLSTASGVGYGGYAGLEARYTWSPASSRLRPFIALSGSGLWLFANILQTQYWYDTGYWESGIDHRISTRQYQVAFIFGLQF
jgi:hypothetical protein